MKKILIINILVTILLIFFLELLINFLGLAQLGGVEAKKLYDLTSENFKYKANATGLVFNKIVYTEKNGLRAPNPNYEYKENNESIIFLVIVLRLVMVLMNQTRLLDYSETNLKN